MQKCKSFTEYKYCLDYPSCDHLLGGTTVVTPRENAPGDKWYYSPKWQKKKNFTMTFEQDVKKINIFEIVSYDRGFCYGSRQVLNMSSSFTEYMDSQYG